MDQGATKRIMDVTSDGPQSNQSSNWSGASDRSEAMDQEASERTGSNRWIGEKGTDQGGIEKSNGSGSNKGAVDVTSDVSGRKRWIREQ